MEKRFTEGQLIGFLKEADVGMPVKELSGKAGVQSCIVLHLACERRGTHLVKDQLPLASSSESGRVSFDSVAPSLLF
ncbi:hypothetical protein QFZ89_007535 [Paraburkholderia youngii]